MILVHRSRPGVVSRERKGHIVVISRQQGVEVC